MEKGVLRNFTKFTRKHLWQSLFFNKVADFTKWSHTLKQFVGVKFLRAPFFMEHLSWLLLTCSALDVEGTLSMRDLLKHI